MSHTLVRLRGFFPGGAGASAAGGAGGRGASGGKGVIGGRVRIGAVVTLLAIGGSVGRRRTEFSDAGLSFAPSSLGEASSPGWIRSDITR